MRTAFALLLLLSVQPGFAQVCIVEVSMGGGITGAATVYRIDQNGKVLKGKGLGSVSFNEQSQLKKSTARKYYKKAVKAVMSNSTFDHPGNIYYSLGTIENGKESRVTWGDSQFAVPDLPKNLYEEINKVLRSLPFTPVTTP